MAGVDPGDVGGVMRFDHDWTHENLTAVPVLVDCVEPRRTVLARMGPDIDWSWPRANLLVGIEAPYAGMVLRTA